MRLTWLVALVAITAMFVLSSIASASPISEHKQGNKTPHPISEH